jgi:hypothetical protein
VRRLLLASVAAGLLVAGCGGSDTPTLAETRIPPDAIGFRVPPGFVRGQPDPKHLVVASAILDERNSITIQESNSPPISLEDLRAAVEIQTRSRQPAPPVLVEHHRGRTMVVATLEPKDTGQRLGGEPIGGEVMSFSDLGRRWQIRCQYTKPNRTAVRRGCTIVADTLTLG